jgi:hypothetical protein
MHAKIIQQQPLTAKHLHYVPQSIIDLATNQEVASSSIAGRANPFNSLQPLRHRDWDTRVDDSVDRSSRLTVKRQAACEATSGAMLHSALAVRHLVEG